ncbi:MAG: DUF664 domain-containing protein [Micromonosporaceae bacterium]|nr:DUF664 domain-containing protein [Micromonosporaceae bacterium]
MSHPIPEPEWHLSDPNELLLSYLDYYRSVIVRKLDGLPDAELRSSRLPSGWTPLELLQHLVFMERRWLRWGFTGEQVPEPHGDRDSEGRFQVGAAATVADLVAALHDGGRRTRAIVAGAALADRAAAGARWAAGDDRPTLGWTLLHVLQEYARHAGQLDVVREIADGLTGE